MLTFKVENVLPTFSVMTTSWFFFSMIKERNKKFLHIRRVKNAMKENGSPNLVFEPANDTDDYTKKNSLEIYDRKGISYGFTHFSFPEQELLYGSGADINCLIEILNGKDNLLDL